MSIVSVSTGKQQERAKVEGLPSTHLFLEESYYHYSRGGVGGGHTTSLKRLRRRLLGNLSTDVREPRTETGSLMFPFLACFCSLPGTGKALVNYCGLKLQTRWRKNGKFQFPVAVRC